MKRTEKMPLIRGILFTVLFIVIFIADLKLERYCKANFSMIWYIVWVCLYPLLLTAFLLFDHIRTWFHGGRLQVEAGYLVLPAVILLSHALVYIPVRLPFRIPILGILPFSINLNPITLLLFWYCLIKAFRREKA